MRRGAGSTSSTDNKVSNVRFRLIGINQDNRADGSGKAGLTFQAIGNSNILSNTSAGGGWRDSKLRKNLNDESTGTIWNAIQSTDFKNNITPVLKTTYNNARSHGYTSNSSSTTIDKLFILSTSEMGMPIIKNYNYIYSYVSHYVNQSDANVHYYDLDSYKNTIKSSSDGNRSYDWASYSYYSEWHSALDYIYEGDTYQWWMLPAGSRKMSNGSQAYHNTDSYSYCSITFTNKNPSTSNICKQDYDTGNKIYWLRSSYCNNSYPYCDDYDDGSSNWVFAYFDYDGHLDATSNSYYKHSVVVAFSF